MCGERTHRKGTPRVKRKSPLKHSTNEHHNVHPCRASYRPQLLRARLEVVEGRTPAQVYSHLQGQVAAVVGMLEEARSGTAV